MRKPKEPVPTREEQRAIILSSVHYSSGDEFNRSDIAPLVGMASENCAFLLASMADDGLLRRREMRPMIVETDSISRLLNERNTALNQIDLLVDRISALEKDLSQALDDHADTGKALLESKKRISALECRMVELPPVREPSEFVTDVDGYVYYWPHGSTQGHYAAHHLRRIATELDDRNKEWDEQIQNDPVLAPAAAYLGEGNE